MRKKIIKLKYLNIKKIKKNEIEILRKERNAAEIRSKMLSQKVITKKDQKSWFKNIVKSKNSEFFNIYYNKILIGSGSIKNIDYQNKRSTWGFYIFKKFTGIFGVMSQYKIIEYAFKKYKLNKLYGETISTNYKILNIHKKFGFKTEGVLKDHLIIKDKKIDIILTALFRNDWINIKKKILNKYFK